MQLNGHVSFSKIAEADAPSVLSWRNSPQVSKYMYTDHVISWSEHKAWFGKILEDLSCRYWIIRFNDVPVGLACVVDIHSKRESASWAFYLADPATRGKGIGLYVEYCVLAWCFDFFELSELACEVLVTNPDVCKLHESVGFEQVRLLPARTTKDETAVDAIAFRMSRAAWVATHREQLKRRLRDRGYDPHPLLSMLEPGFEGERRSRNG